MNETAIAIRPMIYKEARECVDKINTNMNNVRHLILDLHDRKGWEALGYTNWRDCVTAEFKQNQRYLYYQLEAAQTEKNICTIVQKEPIPEGQLRPLSKLEPEQQREAWQKAVETAPEGKVTAAHVSKVVKELTGENTHTQSSPEEDSDAIFHLKRWWKKATKKDRQIFLLWKELTGEQPKPYVLKHEPIIKQELVSEAFQLAYDAIVIELKNARATKWRDTSYKGALEMMKPCTITEQMGR